MSVQKAMSDALATARRSGQWGDAKRAIEAAEAAVGECRFCGNPRPTIIVGRVHCTSCGASGPRVESSAGGLHEPDYRVSHDLRAYPEICESVTLWNTRAPDWQDISTAPRDGTSVLLACGDDINVGWYSDNQSALPRWRWQGNDPWFVPTHWMPLPAPPKEAN